METNSETWKRRAALFTGRIPPEMLGSLARMHVIMWLSKRGWAVSPREGTTSWGPVTEHADTWRPIKGERFRGIDVWEVGTPERLAEMVRDAAYHFGMSQWDVLDEMLALPGNDDA